VGALDKWLAVKGDIVAIVKHLFDLVKYVDVSVPAGATRSTAPLA
jgi:hypothetical protein